MIRKEKVGQLSVIDGILSITVALVTLYIGIRNIEKEVPLFPKEQDIFASVEYYQKDKFILNSFPPLGIQLYSLLPVGSYSAMRLMSLSASSFSLLFLYLAFRRVNVPYLIALVSTVCILSIPLFRKESTRISLDTLQWFWLSISIYSWASLKCFSHFSIKWTIHSLIFAMSIGCSMATKYIGFATWGWAILISSIYFWQMIGDVRLSTSHIVKHTTFQIFCLLVIPMTIFATTLYLQINHSRIDSPEYSQYMSSYYKIFLRSKSPILQPMEITNGSIITIRHLNSLGGYLTSPANESYPEGSAEQIVSLTDMESNVDNQWILEYVDDYNKGPLIDSQRIKLRHRTTGKLLRASSAKPPVSEQEYNSEVSCTGDWDYHGDSDEFWKIDLVEGSLIPCWNIMELDNVGQMCTLISHDTRLPDWGEFEQEVFCIQSPDPQRAKFQIEFVDNDEIKNPITLAGLPGYGNYSRCYQYIKLAAELIQREFKYDYMVKLQNDNDENDKVHINKEKWPIYITGNDTTDLIWLTSSIAVVIVACRFGLQVMNWNPWKIDNGDSSSHLNMKIYHEFAIESLLGWFVHYYIFLKSSNDHLEIVLYLPSFVFAHLLATETVTAIGQWSQWKCAIILLVYIVTIKCTIL